MVAAKRKTIRKRPDHGRENDLSGSNALGRIEINPKVMLGKPVIRGTRIAIELILRKSGEGATEADLISAYPRLRHEDILAAFRYGAAIVAHEEPLTS